MKTKLLIIHSSDELYGSDRILLQVVQALRESYQITVWLPVDHQDGKQQLYRLLQERSVAVQHVDMPILRRALLTPKGLARMARLAPRMVKQLRSSGADQVYLMTSACLLLAPLARVAGRTKTTLHIQEPWGPREAMLLRQLAKFTQQRIAISQTVARSTGFAPTQLSVVHNAVPRLDPENPPTPLALDAADAHGPRYVVASRWVRHKGHGTLLKAWNLAGCPGTLYVLGSAPDSANRIDVKRMVAEFVSDPASVKIIGQVANPQDWFDSVDALVLPTDTVEGCGLVALEAFRHGKAAIVSDSGGPAEVVDDGVDGWIFTAGDVPGLARIFERCTASSLAAMGEAGKRKYEEKYTPERFDEKMRAEMPGVLLGR